MIYIIFVKLFLYRHICFTQQTTVLDARTPFFGTEEHLGSARIKMASQLDKVVEQIDRLTSDFEFELDTDDWTPGTVSSTSSSEKGGPLCDLGPLDFLSSDSWEFCSFLEASTPSDSGDGSDRPPDFRLLNGGATPNGPDSSSEETPVPPQKPLPARTPGSRDRVRFSDKVLYHALCCDDSEDPPYSQETPRDPPRASVPCATIRSNKGGISGVRRGTRKLQYPDSV
ncbi:unnamed protein product [Staurois parvus]|uniref:Inhibitory synaptic factor 1 n=1 Tax=Staurois parvus TaxID=386267 RepID=A0ABN9FCF5_9NEOB|nr:unnamed protein product [Staurois parvus]